MAVWFLTLIPVLVWTGGAAASMEVRSCLWMDDFTSQISTLSCPDIHDSSDETYCCSISGSPSWTRPICCSYEDLHPSEVSSDSNVVANIGIGIGVSSIIVVMLCVCCLSASGAKEPSRGTVVVFRGPGAAAPVTTGPPLQPPANTISLIGPFPRPPQPIEWGQPPPPYQQVWDPAPPFPGPPPTLRPVQVAPAHLHRSQPPRNLRSLVAAAEKY